MNRATLFRRVAVLAYCAFIFYLSSRSEFPEVNQWWPAWLPEPNIFAHFFLYAGLSVVVWFDFRNENSMFLKKRAAVAAIIFCALYGLSDEIHQLFVANRAFQLIDLAMDTLGPIAAMTAASLIFRQNRKPS